MRAQRSLLLAFLLSCTSVRHSSEASAPRTVEFSSGEVRLKAFLWKPTGPGPFPAVLFNHGSGGADAAHTAGMPINVWTVDDADELKRLAQLGVDGVFCNDPGHAISVLTGAS